MIDILLILDPDPNFPFIYHNVSQFIWKKWNHKKWPNIHTTASNETHETHETYETHETHETYETHETHETHET